MKSNKFFYLLKLKKRTILDINILLNDRVNGEKVETIDIKNMIQS